MAELSARAQALLLPVNPAVHPDVDPSRVEGGEWEYANPVALNNRLVFYANAVFEATDEIAGLVRANRAAKLAKKKAERALDAFELRILRLHAAPKGNNTAKALNAHIEKCAVEQDQTGGQLLELQQALHKAEDAVAHNDSRISEIKLWLDAIEVAQQAITVHLSSVKADIGNTRRGGQRG